MNRFALRLAYLTLTMGSLNTYSVSALAMPVLNDTVLANYQQKWSTNQPFFELKAPAPLHSFRSLLFKSQQEEGSALQDATQAQTLKSQIQVQEGFLAGQKGETALQTRRDLIQSYATLVRYVDDLEMSGERDPNFGDLEHYRKVYYSKISVHAKVLGSAVPTQHREWMGLNALSRLVLGDPTAMPLAKQLAQSNADEIGRRLQLQIAVFELPNTPLAKMENLVKQVAAQSVTTESLVVLHLFAAEIAMQKKQTSLAKSFLDEALEVSSTFSTKKKQYKSLLTKIGYHYGQVAAVLQPDRLDANVADKLQKNQLGAELRYYQEKVALNQASKGLYLSASQLYQEIMSQSKLAESTLLLIELRVLDLAIASRNKELLENQWSRVAALSQQRPLPSLVSRMDRTHVWYESLLKSKHTKEQVLEFASLSDLFGKLFKVPSSTSRNLQIAQALNSLGDLTGALERLDLVVANAKTSQDQLQSYWLQKKYLENHLKIPAPNESFQFRFSDGQKSFAEKLVAVNASLMDSDAGRDLGPEKKTPLVFQNYFLNFALSNDAKSTQYLARLIKMGPENKASSVVLSHSLAQCHKVNWPLCEKTARAGWSHKVTPSLAKWNPLESLIQLYVMGGANQHLAEEQWEESISKYKAYIGEFPKGVYLKQAYLQLIGIYDKQNKKEVSLDWLQRMIAHLKDSTDLLPELWRAVKTTKELNLMAQNAQYLELIAEKYPTEIRTKGVLKMAYAERLKLGQLDQAVKNLEWHEQKITEKKEKIQTLQELQTFYLFQEKFQSVHGVVEKVRETLGKNSNSEELMACRSLSALAWFEQGDFSKAQNLAQTLSSLSYRTPEGFQAQVRAKLVLARLQAKDLKAKLATLGLRDGITKYETAKSLLQAVVEGGEESLHSLAYLDLLELNQNFRSNFNAMADKDKVIDDSYLEQLASQERMYRELLKEAVQGAPLLYKSMDKKVVGWGVESQDWIQKFNKINPTQSLEKAPVQATGSNPESAIE